MKLQLFILGLCCLFLAACGSKTSGDGGDTKSDSTTAIENADSKPEAAASNGRYKAGDLLYCYAKSGLVLRDKPDQAGAKVASVPLFGKVDIKDEDPFKFPFSVKESSGMEIKGFWVKANYGGKDGYLFDGYLLKFKPLGGMSDEEYWTSLSKVKSSTDKAPKSDINYFSYKRVDFENGVSWIDEGYEGGAQSSLSIPSTLMSLQEATLFATCAIATEEGNPMVCEFDAAAGEMICTSKDELRLVSINSDGHGNFLIEDSYAD